MATMKKGKKILLIVGGVLVALVLAFMFIPKFKTFVLSVKEKLFKKKDYLNLNPPGAQKFTI